VLLAAVDPQIPFTVLAFFPEYQMRDTRPPNVKEMIRAYEGAKEAGLTQVRLGNLGIFARGAEDFRLLEERVDRRAY